MLDINLIERLENALYSARETFDYISQIDSLSGELNQAVNSSENCQAQILEALKLIKGEYV